MRLSTTEANNLALQMAIQRLIESVTPIPDSESCYVPKLEIAAMRETLKLTMS